MKYILKITTTIIDDIITGCEEELNGEKVVQPTNSVAPKMFPSKHIIYFLPGLRKILHMQVKNWGRRGGELDG
jgi:hypothetical protein